MGGDRGATPQSFAFDCPKCGARHEGSPSIGFSSPHGWDETLRAEDPDSNRLNDDLCRMEDDYFIRCILEVPIREVEQPFLWGVWISQSRENFKLYAETFDATPERVTFGYLSNRIPGYPETLSLHTQVHWQSNGERPVVELKPCDHPLYRDWKEGISWERAMELALPFMHAP